MSEQLKNPQLQVDLKNTTAFEDENGNIVNILGLVNIKEKKNKEIIFFKMIN